MALNVRQQSNPAPLPIQVAQAERRLLYRRRMVGLRASRLRQNLHTHSTSPTVLLLAGGLGFVVGQLKDRQAADVKRPSRNRFVGIALQSISLFTALLRHQPAAGTDAVPSGPPDAAPSTSL